MQARRSETVIILAFGGLGTPNGYVSVRMLMFRELRAESPTRRKRKRQRDGDHSKNLRNIAPTKWTSCSETIACVAFREIRVDTQKPLRA